MTRQTDDDLIDPIKGSLLDETDAYLFSTRSTYRLSLVA